jgi:hypothetical protein
MAMAGLDVNTKNEKQKANPNLVPARKRKPYIADIKRFTAVAPRVGSVMDHSRLCLKSRQPRGGENELSRSQSVIHNDSPRPGNSAHPLVSGPTD